MEERLSEDLRARLDGIPLVIMLDVDGTLAPIAPRPEDATVPIETRRAIGALAVMPDVHIALVSGRSAQDARRIVGLDRLWCIGNHGCELINHGGELTLDPQVEPYRGAVAQAARRLESLAAPIAGVRVEDKGPTLSVHYRHADPAVVPSLRATIESVGTQLGLRMTAGKMVFELRPPVRIDKGTSVLALAKSLGALEENASLMFIGDDETDEDAFRALRSRAPKAVTVRVADDAGMPTAAEATLRDPDEVRMLLEWLVERGELRPG